MSKGRRFWTGMIALGDESDQPAVYRGKEVVISANTWIAAQRALDLIQGCHQLLLGEPPVFPIHLLAHNEKEPNVTCGKAPVQ